MTMATNQPEIDGGISSIVAATMNYERLPDFEVYHAASQCIQDSIERVEPAAGIRVNPEDHV